VEWLVDNDIIEETQGRTFCSEHPELHLP